MSTLVGKIGTLQKIASRSDAVNPQEKQYMLRGTITRGSLTPGDIVLVETPSNFLRTSLVESVQIFDDKLILDKVWAKAKFYDNTPELITDDIILFTMNSIYLLRLEEDKDMSECSDMYRYIPDTTSALGSHPNDE